MLYPYSHGQENLGSSLKIAKSVPILTVVNNRDFLTYLFSRVLPPIFL